MGKIKFSLMSQGLAHILRNNFEAWRTQDDRLWRKKLHLIDLSTCYKVLLDSESHQQQDEAKHWKEQVHQANIWHHRDIISEGLWNAPPVL